MEYKMKHYFFILFLALVVNSCVPISYSVNYQTQAPVYITGSSKYQPNDQNNSQLDYYEFIKGVKYAIINTNEEFQKKYLNDDISSVKLCNLYRMYLHNLGFNYVAITKDEIEKLYTKESLCDITVFTFFFNSNNNYINNIGFDVTSCLGDGFRFVSSQSYRNGSNWESQLYSVLTSLFWHRIIRDTVSRLQLPKQMTKWNEEKIKIYLDESGADEIEGIYEKLRLGGNEWTEAKYKIGIIKNKTGFDVIYIEGANTTLDWTEGELKAKISKSATTNFYTVNWKMANKQDNGDVYCSIDKSGLLNFTYSNSKKAIESKYLKLYPTTSTYGISSSKEFRSSGTGFAITSNGLLVTNYHVIKNAKTITVMNTKVGEKSSYNAEIILSDKHNDLAILQIQDNTFSNLGIPPFSLKMKTDAMGTNVFTLGYPLIDTMGETLKLTDGLISSKTGFQGDISSYQISAPVQPGNSGGPLFDFKGNLIGIVNAKHSGAENVTYAIKTNYLINLLELLPIQPKLPKENRLDNLSLSKKVEEIEKFVFLIKVK